MWIIFALVILLVSYVVMNNKITKEHKVGFCSVCGVAVVLAILLM